MFRALIFLGLIGLAISVPILLNNDSEDGSGLFNTGAADNPYIFHAPQDSASQTPGRFASYSAAGPSSAHEPVYIPVGSFAEVFRFDVTPNWIKARWPRVSVTPPEEGLIGMRVALVTGSHPTDVQGSLTYFFDSKQRAQRITFRGWTGDASRLAGFVQQQFGFTSQKSLAAGMYIKKSWGRTTGVLRLDNQSVVERDLVHEQLMMLMEINNPQGGPYLSEKTTRILGAMPN